MNQFLLVEGKDDLMVFKSLFKQLTIKKSFEVKDCGSVEKLLVSIPIYIKTDNSTIGIVVDADENISYRWQSLKSLLEKIGYTMPDSPDVNGTIVTHEHFPKIGIWIMPDNNKQGMLEDFVNELVPTDDELMPKVDQVLNSIEENSLNNYKEIHRAKAKIHTWLAWQESPGTPMGLAITKTYLNPFNKNCKVFIKWVNKLFNN